MRGGKQRTETLPARPVPVRRVLSGITTSGMPHLGNYAGAIRPAIAASRQPGVESFYSLADYHALIKTADPARLQRSTLETAAAWLAAGLDPDKVRFYRQSDNPPPSPPPFLGELRQAMGLRDLALGIAAPVATGRRRGK